MSEIIGPTNMVLAEEPLATCAVAGARRLFKPHVQGNLDGALSGWICWIEDLTRTLGSVVEVRLAELCSRKRDELIVEIALRVYRANTVPSSWEIEARISINMKGWHHSTKEVATYRWTLSWEPTADARQRRLSQSGD